MRESARAAEPPVAKAEACDHQQPGADRQQVVGALGRTFTGARQLHRRWRWSRYNRGRGSGSYNRRLRGHDDGCRQEERGLRDGLADDDDAGAFVLVILVLVVYAFILVFVLILVVVVQAIK